MTICVKCCDKSIDDVLRTAYEVSARCRTCGGSWVEILLYARNLDVPCREKSECPHCGVMAVIPASTVRQNCLADCLGMRRPSKK